MNKTYPPGSMEEKFLQDAATGFAAAALAKDSVGWKAGGLDRLDGRNCFFPAHPACPPFPPGHLVKGFHPFFEYSGSVKPIASIS